MEDGTTGPTGRAKRDGTAGRTRDRYKTPVKLSRAVQARKTRDSETAKKGPKNAKH